MMSNFVDKRCKIMLCDSNEERGYLRDFDAKHIYLDTGILTLIPHKRIDIVREI